MAGLEQGLLQVYTGNGKGKSTAAFGLALRAAGRGLKVKIVQFLKKPDYGEHRALERLKPEIEIKSFGCKGFIRRGEVKPQDYQQAAKALEYARQAMHSGQADIIILDEINVALDYGLLDEAEVLALLQSRPQNVEVILTGRNASQKIVAAADLVTEMCEIKHPYTKGVSARKGIEY
ncbi:MAG: cob(I)yrinic acid a,c-diamide adenosyltransferase [Clostridia bacterium]|nr:cob(I)yrinic acid a,c-diamide adenosyltransferase [Clostridia bacterium]